MRQGGTTGGHRGTQGKEHRGKNTGETLRCVLQHHTRKCPGFLRIPGTLLSPKERCYLDSSNVLRLPALGALGHVELHGLAFLQALESARLNSGEMHENVLAILTADEAVAFGVVKPLHCSLFCH